MKYRYKLIEKIYFLKNKYNIKLLKPKNKYKDLNNLLIQVNKLTPFINDFSHSTLKNIQNRIWFIENNFKDLPKCHICKENIKTFGAKYCSSKCQKIYFDRNESHIKKMIRVLRAARSRDYEHISKKGHKTRKENGTHESWKKSISSGLSKIEENGLTVAQNRGVNHSEYLQNLENGILLERANKSAKTRKENGKNSSQTFWDSITEEERKDYNKKRYKSFKETMISSGKMISDDDRDDCEIYYKAGQFKHGFKTQNEDEIALLNEFGVFHNINNTKGCVRDHLLSRRYGFDNCIPTWIISHPANCEIVLHSENVSRAHSKDEFGDNQITFEELLERIEKYNSEKSIN